MAGVDPTSSRTMARAVIDVRASTRDDAQRIEDAIRALSPERTGNLVAGARRFFSPRRWSAARRWPTSTRWRARVAAELGHDLAEGSAGGGSDGNLTAALGIPTLDGLGAIGDGAHRTPRARRDRPAALAGRAARRFDSSPRHLLNPGLMCADGRAGRAGRRAGAATVRSSSTQRVFD